MKGHKGAKVKNMSKFTDKAKKVTSGSFLTEGKEKIDMTDLIRNYKKGITITGVDFLKDKDGKEFGAFTFAEDNTKFFFGGQVLTDIAKSWAEDYEDMKELSEDLAKDGGVQVLLTTKRSKNGREYTAVEVL